MVAIGRALMARPRLLLLDEPSLGLAPLIVQDMFDAIRRINAEGIAVLLVEQNVAMAMAMSDRAYVLEEGRIVAEGEPDELLGAPGDPACLPRRLRAGIRSQTSGDRTMLFPTTIVGSFPAARVADRPRQARRALSAARARAGSSGASRPSISPKRRTTRP